MKRCRKNINREPPAGESRAKREGRESLAQTLFKFYKNIKII